MSDLATVKSGTGYTSLIRWCPNPIRSEYKNIAVILISNSDKFRGMKYLKSYQMPTEIRNIDILSGWLVSFEKGLRGVYLPELSLYSRTLNKAILITPPKPCTVVGYNWEQCLEDLYKMLVEPVDD